MASAVNTTIKGTIDNYVNSREFNNREEVEERFEGLTREVINQELQGTKTICEKAVKVTDKAVSAFAKCDIKFEVAPPGQAAKIITPTAISGCKEKT